MTQDTPPRIRCRPIGDADIEGLIELLSKGFPNRTRGYWARAMQQLARRETPAPYPRFGYVLELDGTQIGVILLIFSTQNARGKAHIRCNISSWYAALSRLCVPFHRRGCSPQVRHNVNISPAVHTWPLIEAQGFMCYCFGEIMAFPALSPPVANTCVHEFDSRRDYGPTLSEEERDILVAHGDYGCLAYIVTENRTAIPFAFLPRLSLRGIVPTLQLVYCRDVRDFARFAGPIGRALMRRGSLFVRLDAAGPLPGLVGKYIPDRGRRYFKGPERPRIGDLTFSEGVLFGFDAPHRTNRLKQAK